ELAVAGVWLRYASEAKQDESELEWAPALLVRGFRSGRSWVGCQPICSRALRKHREVGKPEGFPHGIVRPIDETDAGAHPFDRLVAVLEMGLCGISILRLKPRNLLSLLVDPARVVVAERVEIIDHLAAIGCGDPLHAKRTSFDLIVAVREQQFMLWQKCR